MKKSVVIGSSGFVGRHIAEALTNTTYLFATSRDKVKCEDNTLYFDLQNRESWKNILAVEPDIIINSAGYGVIKDQENLVEMFDVNYLAPMELILMLQKSGIYPIWIQIGTAFEYDLSVYGLTEQSEAIPSTHYGMSKLLLSNFLFSSKNKLPYTLLRPFAMFGPHENDSKIVPYLIKAQFDKKAVALSDGFQKRDYFYVKDLASFVKHLVMNNQAGHNQVFNVASGEAISIRELSGEIAKSMASFDASYWQWGKIPKRLNEGDIFFNISSKAQENGFKLTALTKAIEETVHSYSVSSFPQQ